MATLLDDNGNQPPNPSSNPDYTVDGKFHDVKSPDTVNPDNAIRNSLGSSVQSGQAQNLDINLGRTELTTDDLERALEDLVARPPEAQGFGGDASAFEDFFSFTSPDGTKFPVESISVIEDGVVTQIWPLGAG